MQACASVDVLNFCLNKIGVKKTKNKQKIHKVEKDVMCLRLISSVQVNGGCP